MCSPVELHLLNKLVLLGLFPRDLIMHFEDVAEAAISAIVNVLASGDSEAESSPRNSEIGFGTEFIVGE